MGFTQDVRSALGLFPTPCLQHALDHQGQLISRNYEDAKGRGCLFNMLSRALPEELRIRSNTSLVRYYTGQEIPEADLIPFATTGRMDGATPELLAMRRVMRVFDGNPVTEYGESGRLRRDDVIRELKTIIEERRSAEAAHEGRQSPAALVQEGV